MIARQAVFDNVAARLRTACEAQQQPPPPPPNDNQSLFNMPPQKQHHQQLPPAHQQQNSALLPGEYVLVAEIIFWLAYTVQLTRDEALALWDLLTAADRAHDVLFGRHRQTRPSSRGYSFTHDAVEEDNSMLADIPPPPLVEARERAQSSPPLVDNRVGPIALSRLLRCAHRIIRREGVVEG